MSESLWLKSAESPSANVDSKQPNPSAVLCTDDHTYQLRQVQSSNSVFMLQPSESRRDDDEVPSPSLLAIAQCTATLELIPSDNVASSAMASRLLKKSLPSYRGIDTDVGLGTDTTFSSKKRALLDIWDGLWRLTWYLGEYKDKNAILQDAPVSTKEFDKTWKQQCAFEVLGCARLPTPSALAMIWKSILSAATVSGVNLEKGFDLKSLAEMVGSDGFPLAFFMAVMIRLVSDTEHLNDDCEYRTSSRAVFTSDINVKDIHLSRDKTVLWVGIVCLQRAGESEQANKEGIVQKDFLAQWHDLLPEGWRKHASMDLLKVQKSSIMFLLSRPDNHAD